MNSATKKIVEPIAKKMLEREVSLKEPREPELIRKEIQETRKRIKEANKKLDAHLMNGELLKAAKVNKKIEMLAVRLMNLQDELKETPEEHDEKWAVVEKQKRNADKIKRIIESSRKAGMPRGYEEIFKFILKYLVEKGEETKTATVKAHIGTTLALMKMLQRGMSDAKTDLGRLRRDMKMREWYPEG